MFKNYLKKLSAGILSVVCICTMSACATVNDNNPGNSQGGAQSGTNTQPNKTSAQQQIELAQQTYNAFYNKGELFTANPAKKIAAVALSDEGEDEIEDPIVPTFADVRNALAGYNWINQNSTAIFNTYVGDIFSYSQVQTSIIDQFGEDSLTDVYSLSYEGVDWSQNPVDYIQQTKLISAAFVGADLQNGHVYCTQSHKLNNVLITADLEYYYNSDDDMGVTTINYHGDGTFEYHYCSAGTFENLVASGTYDNNGVQLTNFIFYSQNAFIVRLYNMNAEHVNTVFNYVQSQIARVSGKIDELKQANGRQSLPDGSEDEAGDNVKVCTVNMDFAILTNMLIK